MKSERFKLISRLRGEGPSLNVNTACEALEVSRRGYYDWLTAEGGAERERADLDARRHIEQALSHRGFKKGTRQVVDCLSRTQSVVMNRKKVR